MQKTKEKSGLCFIISLLCLFAPLATRAQPCFINIEFIKGFHQKKVSFYINDKTIFKDEDLSTLHPLASAELTRMYLLLVPNSDSTFYVANMHSTATYNITSHLQVTSKWYKKGLSFKVVINGKSYVQQVDFSKGQYIDIYLEDNKLFISEAKEPYRND